MDGGTYSSRTVITLLSEKPAKISSSSSLFAFFHAGTWSPPMEYKGGEEDEEKQKTKKKKTKVEGF